MCAEECCLCYSNVSSGTLRAKRISINGNAAKVVMDVMNSLTLKFLGLKLSDRFNSQASFVTSVGVRQRVCSSCK
uniref:Uncharacterized protein n=1 Tax=Amphimedon queenslandica TaxID=400682 RepID=A0A1X7UZL6_AMPQE